MQNNGFSKELRFTKQINKLKPESSNYVNNYCAVTTIHSPTP